MLIHILPFKQYITGRRKVQESIGKQEAKFFGNNHLFSRQKGEKKAEKTKLP